MDFLIDIIVNHYVDKNMLLANLLDVAMENEWLIYRIGGGQSSVNGSTGFQRDICITYFAINQSE